MTVDHVSRFELLAWGARELVRFGWPRRIVDSYVGIGDELMAMGALRDFHSTSPAQGKTWFLTRYPGLHVHAQLPVVFVPWNARYFRLGLRLRRPMVHLQYSQRDEVTGIDRPLPGHAITNMARQLGVEGPVKLKPHLNLTPTERTNGRLYERQIVVQSSASGARLPIPTKEWPVERMQTVVDRLRTETGLPIIQIGTPNEPALQNVDDRRGRLDLRGSAAVLANAAVFIGLVGGLMHLARAVECPAVIVYGGREEPTLAGYAANIAVATKPVCSPCYLINDCPNGLVCMDDIQPDRVIDAAHRQLARHGRPLPVDTVVVTPANGASAQ